MSAYKGQMYLYQLDTTICQSKTTVCPLDTTVYPFEVLVTLQSCVSSKVGKLCSACNTAGSMLRGACNTMELTLTQQRGSGAVYIIAVPSTWSRFYLNIAIFALGWRRCPDVVQPGAVRHPEFDSRLSPLKNEINIKPNFLKA